MILNQHLRMAKEFSLTGNRQMISDAFQELFADITLSEGENTFYIEDVINEGQ